MIRHNRSMNWLHASRMILRILIYNWITCRYVFRLKTYQQHSLDTLRRTQIVDDRPTRRINQQIIPIWSCLRWKTTLCWQRRALKTFCRFVQSVELLESWYLYEKVRQENLKLQNSRKSRYGKPSATSLALPRPGGISTDDESQEIVPLINPQGQQLAVPDQSYVESRAEAVTNIESHIVELGQIFNRLSVMINEQGDMVQRIDDNVEDTVSNITSGQNELMRYFQNLSDNRMLALKVFAILFSFMIFFLVFLA